MILCNEESELTISDFFLDYITPGSVPGLGANINKCDYNQPPPPGKVCDVDVKNWYPCTKENKYNYHKSAPCIFLKLNKVMLIFFNNIFVTYPCLSTLNYLTSSLFNIYHLF